MTDRTTPTRRSAPRPAGPRPAGPRPAGRPLRRSAATALASLLLAGCAALPSASADDPGRTVDGMNVPYGAYLAGEAALQARDYTAAERFFGQAMSVDPANPDVILRAYLAAVSGGDRARAVALAPKVLAGDPQNLLAVLQLAVDDIANQRYAAADDKLAGLPKTGIANLVAPLARAWMAAAQHDPAKVDEQLKALGDVGALKPLVTFHRALMADYLGDRAQAEATYKSLATSDQQQTFRVVQVYGAMLERTGQRDQAQALYRQFANNPDAAELVKAMIARAEAGGVAPPAPTPADGVAQALFDVGSLLQRERQGSDMALIAARLSLELEPDFVLAQLLLGEVLEDDHLPAQANAVYGAIDAASPLKWTARLRVANNLDSMGQTDEAIAQLTQMAAERPQNPDASARIGDILRAHNRPTEAITAYDEAITRAGTIDKDDWSLLFSRAIAFEQAKQWPKAEEDLVHVLQIVPDEPYVLNYLGYSWIDQQKNIDRAKSMIEKAVSLRPRDGSIVDSLGWAYYRLGDFPKAVAQLERAVELRPQDAVINDHYGDALWQVGRRNEARFQWQRVLTLEPDTDLKGTVERKLASGLGATASAQPQPAKP